MVEATCVPWPLRSPTSSPGTNVCVSAIWPARSGWVASIPGVEHRDGHARAVEAGRPGLRRADLRDAVGEVGLDLPVQPELRDATREARRERLRRLTRGVTVAQKRSRFRRLVEIAAPSMLARSRFFAEPGGGVRSAAVLSGAYCAISGSESVLLSS